MCYSKHWVVDAASFLSVFSSLCRAHTLLFVHAYRKCGHMNALMCQLECQICYSLAKSYHMSWEFLATLSLWSSSGKYRSL